jgi:hypothetical protein
MYLIPIHVPIFVRDGRAFIGTEWKRSLELLRDSFGGRFGPLVALDGDRTRLAGLPPRAGAVALEHPADRWIQRRAAWTVEMVEQRRFGARPAAVAP